MARKGLKTNPFEVGDKVRIFPMQRTGTIAEVLQPENPRGWIRYVVEFRRQPGCGPATGVWPSSQLEYLPQARESE